MIIGYTHRIYTSQNLSISIFSRRIYLTCLNFVKFLTSWNQIWDFPTIKSDRTAIISPNFSWECGKVKRLCTNKPNWIILEGQNIQGVAWHTCQPEYSQGWKYLEDHFHARQITDPRQWRSNYLKNKSLKFMTLYLINSLLKTKKSKKLSLTVRVLKINNKWSLADVWFHSV